MCCVPQCSNRCSEGVSLHVFPRAKTLRKKILRIGKAITPYFVVYSAHFKTEHFHFPTQQYHHVFSDFEFFNSIQSQLLDELLHSDTSIVVSAPTGSGKTALFELAIIRILEKCQSEESHLIDIKIVYMAPVKALCSERYNDWESKFQSLGIKAIEVTGDSDEGNLLAIQHFNLVMTTPEKWDALTRKWRDHTSLVSVIKLFLIDEVHLLNEDKRGSTLEAVVSRMKTVCELSSSSIRFIALSATIPNIEDVGLWLGKKSSPAKCYIFGEETRPVRLNKIVKGYPFGANVSYFKFDLSLSYKLKQIILDYSEGKPTLIFCSTRKSVLQTSTTMLQNLTFHFTNVQKMTLDEARSVILDSKLKEMIRHGIGFHHAGLLTSDRRCIENLFRSGFLPVLVCTSTLAMGVNLPAHLVIIKSTAQYINGAWEEYSEGQVLQMMGRAGRPQFDTSATAVVLTKISLKDKYEKLLMGNERVESNLHKNLAEHLNSEVVLGTITDVAVAVQWIRSTFLYVRALKNPRYYGIPDGLTTPELEARLQALCLRELNALEKYELIKKTDFAYNVEPTENGKLMARLYIAFETMKIFMKVKGTENLPELLELICMCHEFSDVQLRVNEKTSLNVLNNSKNRESIRFTLPGKIKSRDMKVNCLLQAYLGSIMIADPSLNQEANKIVRIAGRIIKALSLYLWQKDFHAALESSLILSKCLSARMWENSIYICRQLPGIGPALCSLLVAAKKITIESIIDSNPRDLERILNKHPPFGNNLQEAAKCFPKYELTLLYRDLSKKVCITIRMVNPENMIDFYHTCSLLVAGSNNKLLHKEKIRDSYIVDHGGVYDINIPVPSRMSFIIAHLISDKLVGFDVKKKISLTKECQDSPWRREHEEFQYPEVEYYQTPLKSVKVNKSIGSIEEKSIKQRNQNQMKKMKGKGVNKLQTNLHQYAFTPLRNKKLLHNESVENGINSSQELTQNMESCFQEKSMVSASCKLSSANSSSSSPESRLQCNDIINTEKEKYECPKSPRNIFRQLQNFSNAASAPATIQRKSSRDGPAHSNSNFRLQNNVESNGFTNKTLSQNNTFNVQYNNAETLCCQDKVDPPQMERTINECHNNQNLMFEVDTIQINSYYTNSNKRFCSDNNEETRLNKYITEDNNSPTVQMERAVKNCDKKQNLMPEDNTIQEHNSQLPGEAQLKLNRSNEGDKIGNFLKRRFAFQTSPTEFLFPKKLLITSIKNSDMPNDVLPYESKGVSMFKNNSALFQDNENNHSYTFNVNQCVYEGKISEYIVYDNKENNLKEGESCTEYEKVNDQNSSMSKDSKTQLSPKDKLNKSLICNLKQNKTYEEKEDSCDLPKHIQLEKDSDRNESSLAEKISETYSNENTEKSEGKESISELDDLFFDSPEWAKSVEECKGNELIISTQSSTLQHLKRSAGDDSKKRNIMGSNENVMKTTGIIEGNNLKFSEITDNNSKIAKNMSSLRSSDSSSTAAPFCELEPLLGQKLLRCEYGDPFAPIHDSITSKEIIENIDRPTSSRNSHNKNFLDQNLNNNDHTRKLMDNENKINCDHQIDLSNDQNSSRKVGDIMLMSHTVQESISHELNKSQCIANSVNTPARQKNSPSNKLIKSYYTPKKLICATSSKSVINSCHETNWHNKELDNDLEQEKHLIRPFCVLDGSVEKDIEEYKKSLLDKSPFPSGKRKFKKLKTDEASCLPMTGLAYLAYPNNSPEFSHGFSPLPSPSKSVVTSHKPQDQPVTYHARSKFLQSFDYSLENSKDSKESYTENNTASRSIQTKDSHMSQSSTHSQKTSSHVNLKSEQKHGPNHSSHVTSKNEFNNPKNIVWSESSMKENQCSKKVLVSSEHDFYNQFKTNFSNPTNKHTDLQSHPQTLNDHLDESCSAHDIQKNLDSRYQNQSLTHQTQKENHKHLSDFTIHSPNSRNHRSQASEYNSQGLFKLDLKASQVQSTLKKDYENHQEQISKQLSGERCQSGSETSKCHLTFNKPKRIPESKSDFSSNTISMLPFRENPHSCFVKDSRQILTQHSSRQHLDESCSSDRAMPMNKQQRNPQSRSDLTSETIPKQLLQKNPHGGYDKYSEKNSSSQPKFDNPNNTNTTEFVPPSYMYQRKQDYAPEKRFKCDDFQQPISNSRDHFQSSSKAYPIRGMQTNTQVGNKVIPTGCPKRHFSDKCEAFDQEMSPNLHYRNHKQSNEFPISKRIDAEFSHSHFQPYSAQISSQPSNKSFYGYCEPVPVMMCPNAMHTSQTRFRPVTVMPSIQSSGNSFQSSHEQSLSISIPFQKYFENVPAMVPRQTLGHRFHPNVLRQIEMQNVYQANPNVMEHHWSTQEIVGSITIPPVFGVSNMPVNHNAYATCQVFKAIPINRPCNFNINKEENSDPDMTDEEVSNSFCANTAAQFSSRSPPLSGEYFERAISEGTSP